MPDGAGVQDRSGNALRRHAVLAYVVAAFAISWACWLPIALAGATVRPGDGWPSHFPGLAGPLVAAFLVTAFTEGRAGVRALLADMTRWRVGRRWWAVAAGSPLLFFAVALALAALTGEAPNLGDLDEVGGLPEQAGVLGVWAVLVVVNGYGEEIGWRGYALPQLQRRYSPLVATLVLTVFWALWHAPLFLIAENFRGFDAVTLPGFFLGMLCGAVVLTWLYNSAAGSVLIVAVWHGTYNLAAATQASQGTVAAIVTTIVMVWAVILVVLELRARRTGNRSVLAGRPPERPQHAPAAV